MASPATKSRKQVLDEDSFQQLLAAAFVVQEHNASQQDNVERAPVAAESARTNQGSSEISDILVESRPAYAYVMEEIVATQHQIQTRRLELQQAIQLIIQRLLPIAHADGAAIALLEGNTDELVYRVAVGRSSSIAGRRMSTAEALCAESVRNGTTLQCPDAASDFRVDPALCEQRGAGGVISVPVYRDEAIAGALELIFSKPGAFLDHDVRTCQLMAGMVTEALDRAAEAEFKQALVNERATMLEALEKLKPQLERLVETPSGAPQRAKPQPSSCAACGSALGEQDLHCGRCGTARDSRAGQDIQSKLASMVRNSGAELAVTKSATPSVDQPSLNIDDKVDEEKNSGAGLLKAPSRTTNLPSSQQFEEFQEKEDEEFEIPSSVIDELEATLRAYDPDRSAASSTMPEFTAAEVAAAAENESIEEIPDQLSKNEVHAADSEEGASPEDMQLRITPASQDAWTSASKAKAWLESVTDPVSRSAAARFIKHRRAEIYLCAAILVVAYAVWWSVWGGGSSWTNLGSASNPTAADGSPASPRRRAKPSGPELTWYEKFLVSIGLAEAPPAPVYMGNPDVKVWVDLQTALYYCPNADLYGKTPKGKFTTQQDAQLDQFEPAYRKACD